MCKKAECVELFGVVAKRCDRPGSDIRNGQGFFFSATKSKPVPGAPSQGYSGRGVKLATHVRLVPRLRMRGGLRLQGVMKP
jgi:hypothetical protein